MATYCRHPYIQLRARSSVSLSGGSILQSKAGPFLASREDLGQTLQRIRENPLGLPAGQPLEPVVNYGVEQVYFYYSKKHRSEPALECGHS